uniref:Uncharacterized protein n=1 Tax=Timema cristinae TaxID=61476 RepID=A0A7R9CVZ7_TIMCR|nr:unnamed protein product [Timema cristinae]
MFYCNPDCRGPKQETMEREKVTDYIRSIRDPEKPATLEDLHVVYEDGVMEAYNGKSGDEEPLDVVHEKLKVEEDGGKLWQEFTESLEEYIKRTGGRWRGWQIKKEQVEQLEKENRRLRENNIELEKKFAIHIAEGEKKTCVPTYTVVAATKKTGLMEGTESKVRQVDESKRRSMV